MWTHQDVIDTTATPEAIFALFRDVQSWPEWNPGVERMELDGPFAAGTSGRMTIPGQPPMATSLTWVEEPRGFEDETPIDDLGVVVRVRHEIEQLASGHVRIVYTTMIDGPNAETAGPEVGPMVSGDFPEVMAALAARAEAAASATR